LLSFICPVVASDVSVNKVVEVYVCVCKDATACVLGCAVQSKAVKMLHFDSSV